MEIKSSMFVNNDENLPQVPPIIYEELKKNFNIDAAVEEFKDYQEMEAIKQRTRESKKKI